MLTPEKIDLIKRLLTERPHSVREIASSLEVSWKTADKYLETLCKQDNSVGIHVFKDGMRGGLKIAFLNPVARNTNQVMEFLHKRIVGAREKRDFSPFEIYQYVDENFKKAFWEAESATFIEKGSEDINNLLRSTETSYLSFSGDFSWVLSKENGKMVIKTIESLAEKGVRIHMLGRIDMKSLVSVERLLNLNERFGVDAIDIRHADQPLRGAIVDDKLVRLVESPVSLKKTIYYEITDPKWVKFVSDIFWEFHRVSVPARRRVEEIRKLI